MSSLPFPTSLDSAKLNWAFKLYDVDNDGMIDLHEMSVIMETLDSIEGIKPGMFAGRVSRDDYLFKCQKN